MTKSPLCLSESEQPPLTTDIVRNSFWQEIQADAEIASGESPCLKVVLKLFLFHSGFQLLLLVRIASRLKQYGYLGKFFSKVFLKLATDLTGCHINAEAQLEGGIHFPHATGIVIGAAIVKKGTSIYQNVSLGRKSIKDKGYPTVCEGCVIYAGAQVLGPVVLGRGATIGSNAVVLSSVPDYAVAVGIPARIILK
ncbi:MAG: hypothetical protein KME16_02110 [Scytolyngbya sp. HA4215-MV1]|jgi:serine O-acetyltransferase|nr:hypothetical protein [Scytolyngbya sp. HA4215-MV1]